MSGRVEAAGWDALARFAAVADDLVGMTVSHVWRGLGSALFIEFGELTPRLRGDGSTGNPEGELSLGVEWDWRIEDATSIVFGSGTTDEDWPAHFRRLNGLHVWNLQLTDRLPEIDLAFSNGFRLRTFCTGDSQPQWFVIDKRISTAGEFCVEDGRVCYRSQTER